MQYSKIFSTLLTGVLAITGAQAQTYRLSVDPVTALDTNFYIVSWVNAYPSGAYVGNVKLQQNAEPLIINFSEAEGRISFLTYHAERYQTWYILKDEAKPVAIDLWQGIPPTANQTGFTIDSDGYLGYAGDNSKWAVCPVESMTKSYQIYWIGGENTLPTGCIATKIKTWNYGVCPVAASGF